MFQVARIQVEVARLVRRFPEIVAFTWGAEGAARRLAAPTPVATVLKGAGAVKGVGEGAHVVVVRGEGDAAGAAS